MNNQGEQFKSFKSGSRHLQRYLPLLLLYVPVQDLGVHLEVCVHRELIGFHLRLTEDHDAAVQAAVNTDDIADQARTILVDAADS